MHRYIAQEKCEGGNAYAIKIRGKCSWKEQFALTVNFKPEQEVICEQIVIQKIIFNKRVFEQSNSEPLKDWRTVAQPEHCSSFIISVNGTQRFTQEFGGQQAAD